MCRINLELRGPARRPHLTLCLKDLPARFRDDGCSNSPDDLGPFADFRRACRLHDARYCTRLWPPGTLTSQWRHDSDAELRLNIQAETTWGLRWVAWLYFRGVHRFGGDDAFDSCDPDSIARQRRNLVRRGEEIPDWMVRDLCRHNLPRPVWMT